MTQSRKTSRRQTVGWWWGLSAGAAFLGALPVYVHVVCGCIYIFWVIHVVACHRVMLSHVDISFDFSALCLYRRKDGRAWLGGVGCCV